MESVRLVTACQLYAHAVYVLLLHTDQHAVSHIFTNWQTGVPKSNN